MNNARSFSGFSTIEVMISVALLSVGVLGAVQAQVLASNQNGNARRMMRAAAISRDFVESAQRWQYTDGRLNSSGVACGAIQTLTEHDLGGGSKPPNPFQFTAATGTDANLLGTTTGALTLSGASYEGVAPSLLSGGGGYQLMWSAFPIRTLSTSTACQAIQVQVVVRYPIGSSTYRSLVTTFIKYDPSIVSGSGIPEQI